MLYHFDGHRDESCFARFEDLTNNEPETFRSIPSPAIVAMDEKLLLISPRLPLHPSSSSKIPFRPKKIRRILSDKPASTKLVCSHSFDSIESATDASSEAEKLITTQPPSHLLKTLRSLTSSVDISVAIEYLRSSEPLLASLIDSFQIPQFRSSNPPFAALARSILYQQLATKAADSIYCRFTSLCGSEASVLPDIVLALSASKLREIGVSGRKASYLHDLATKFRDGTLSDSSILAMDDEELLTNLTRVKGIGAWSVHMFMIFSLHRPNVLPIGDLGVRKGVQKLYGLKELPKPSEMEKVCETWKPYRSVGSWYMWRLMEAKGVLPIPISEKAPLMENC